MDSTINEKPKKDNAEVQENKPPKNKKPKLTFTAYDTAFAWASLLMGFVIACALPVTRNMTGGVMAVAALFIFSFVYMKLCKVKVEKKNIFFAIVIMLYSVGFLTGANAILQTCALLFIAAAYLYWVYTVFALNGGRVFGENCVAHLLTAIFVTPINSVWYIFPAFIIRDKKNIGAKIIRTAIFIFLGLCAAVVPTIVIILLLSYDKQFTDLLGRIFNISFTRVFRFVGDMIFGAILAVGIFAALFGSKRQNQINGGEEKKVTPPSCHVIPKALACAAVTPILAVYVIFFISQWDYYISAFTKRLPEELTYAEYARSGFFQLCWVCAINAVILLLFNLLVKKSKKKGDPIRAIYSSVISVFTLILVATAMSKMLLYIDSFGLTRKRVYASWLILLLAAFFIAVLIKQIVRRLPLAPVLAVTFAVFFALVAIPNVDSMIASYNVDNYLSGKLDTVDVAAIEAYGVSSVPALTELKGALEEKPERDGHEEYLLFASEEALRNIKVKLEAKDRNVFTFNIPTEIARDLLEDIELEQAGE